MICGSVSNIEESLADNCDNQRLHELQFSAGSDAKRKLYARPTKYNFPKFAPFRFCGYLSNNEARLIIVCICKSNVKIAVLFCSQLNDATRQSIPFLFRLNPF
jgi:hypothetical protein